MELDIGQRHQLIVGNLDLPPRLYNARFHRQAAGTILGEDECVAIGNLALVRSSWRWHGNGAFRDYAAVSIIHAVNLALRRQPLVRGGALSVLVRLPIELVELCDREARLTLDDTEAVIAVLFRLSEHDRQILVDRVVNDLTFREIGQRRGIGWNAALKRFNKALGSARAVLHSLGMCQP